MVYFFNDLFSKIKTVDVENTYYCPYFETQVNCFKLSAPDRCLCLLYSSTLPLFK